MTPVGPPPEIPGPLWDVLVGAFSAVCGWFARKFFKRGK